MRITTGKGNEDDLTNEGCKRIIDEEIKPAFRQQDYYQGLNNAVQSVMEKISQALNQKEVGGSVANNVPVTGNSTSSIYEEKTEASSMPTVLLVLLFLF